MSTQIDLISNLPDEILGKILSSVPTKLAASTSVLSKRWRNLLAHLDKLEFSDASGPHGFSEFVEKTLALFRKSRTIKRFYLDLTQHEPEHESSRVTSWIRTALECGCLELHLEYIGIDRIQTEILTNNTLLDLTIRDTLYPDRPHETVMFPALKSLSLISLGFESVFTYQEIISGCPGLENLSLHYSEYPHPPNWSGVVSSPSIKKLTIFHSYPSYRDAHDDIFLETPNLMFLDYSGYIADNYEVVLPSLVEARLDLRPWKELISDSDESDEDVETFSISGDVTALVAGISIVKTLHLSSDSLEVFHFCCKSMPVFNNLLKLSFESHEEKGWQVLPHLLNNSPNLKTLVIKGLVHQVTDECGDACACIRKKKKKSMDEEVCCLSTCQVKLLTISGYQGTSRELKQMRHFLGNLKYLETVKVGVKVNHQEDNIGINTRYLKITNALIKLPEFHHNAVFISSDFVFLFYLINTIYFIFVAITFTMSSDESFMLNFYYEFVG